MKTTTLELIRSVLKADETVSQDERARIIRAMTTPPGSIPPPPAKIIPFKTAADRLGVKPRTIYHYCRAGILKAAKIAGKERANGVTEESLEMAIKGGGDIPQEGSSGSTNKDNLKEVSLCPIPPVMCSRRRSVSTMPGQCSYAVKTTTFSAYRNPAMIIHTPER